MTESTASAILLTLRVASVATLIVFVPGMLLAYYFARRNSPFSRILSTLTLLPMVLPPTAVGYLLLRLFAADGPFGPQILGFHLNLLLTWKAAVIASGVMAMPLFVRTAQVAFQGVDHRLELMKRTLGFGPVETFLRTTLPLASRGLLAATILGFIRAVSEFGATITVAGNIPFKTQTMASAIFSAQQAGNEEEANILIVLALALGFFSIFATELLARRSPAVGHP
ncbi:MAG TPA: molybdenum ABC transporter permease [Bdellovibrionota bacterium]|nr:molybdenum ABC transporter permease [Bdellovibrionota bacterium]